MMERYGTRSALLSDQFKEKKKATSLERFGVEHGSQTEHIKQKTKETNRARYRVDCGLQLESIREKGKATMMELYGVEHAFQCDELKDKRVQTYRERYGVDSPLQNKDVLQRRKKTNLERYQTEEVLQHQGIRNRIAQTMIDTYGAVNPLHCESIKQKKDQTCEERYGHKDIMRNTEMFEKAAKNGYKRKEYILPSGAAIMYQGYENIAWKVLLSTIEETEITNDPKLMPLFIYEWGGKTHRYYPDLYVISQHRIIEVKSTYTYRKELDKNRAKRDQVLADGYAFEFWICSKEKVLHVLYGKDSDTDGASRVETDAAEIVIDAGAVVVEA
jgi:hypothetical protein